MQKLSYNIGFGLFVLFLWNSCEKIERKPDTGRIVTYVDPYSGLVVDTNTLGLFQIYNYNYGDRVTSSQNYSVSGSVNTNYWSAGYLNDIPAGEFTFNGNEIYMGGNNYYERNINNTDSNFYFGKNATVKLTGNLNLGVEAFERTFYIPEAINFKIKSRPFFLKTNTNQLEWNSDPNYKGKVHIIVSYKGHISNRLDPALPTEDIHFWFNAPDNGKFDIPDHVFAQMPVGGIINVEIGRGTYIVVPNNSKNICVNANTIRSIEFDLK